MTTSQPHIVLVVEDEVDIRLTLDYNLRKEGYDTLLAGTGEEALDILHHEPLPSLILLDWMLPGMKGNRGMPEDQSIRHPTDADPDAHSKINFI